MNINIVTRSKKLNAFVEELNKSVEEGTFTGINSELYESLELNNAEKLFIKGDVIFKNIHHVPVYLVQLKKDTNPKDSTESVIKSMYKHIESKLDVILDKETGILLQDIYIVFYKYDGEILMQARKTLKKALEIYNKIDGDTFKPYIRKGILYIDEATGRDVRLEYTPDKDDPKAYAVKILNQVFEGTVSSKWLYKDE